jgi:hypothetical protein
LARSTHRSESPPAGHLAIPILNNQQWPIQVSTPTLRLSRATRTKNPCQSKPPAITKTKTKKCPPNTTQRANRIRPQRKSLHQPRINQKIPRLHLLRLSNNQRYPRRFRHSYLLPANLALANAIRQRPARANQTRVSRVTNLFGVRETAWTASDRHV